jgi:hypothetical protein
MADIYVQPESVSFECPYCGRTIRLSQRRDAVPVTKPGAKHVRYAHGDCRPALKIIEGGRP